MASCVGTTTLATIGRDSGEDGQDDSACSLAVQSRPWALSPTLTRLEELPAPTASRILERLIRLDHDARQVRRRDGGEAGA
jgi:hypothetical protein